MESNPQASPEKSQLRLGLPSGSLEDPTFDLFAKAGYKISRSSRSYKPSVVDDDEITVRLLRAQEMSSYVEDGFLDCGITGKDWIAENRSDVQVLCDLAYSRSTRNPVRWVLAVPENSPIHSVKDLEGKRIATEAHNLVTDFLARHGVTAHVEFSWGATEVKVPDLVDAIVDITETGSSLRANKLRIVDTLIESYPQFIANRAAYEDERKRQKMDRLVTLLTGALNAQDKVGLKMNVPGSRLETLLERLPSLRHPTVNQLHKSDWVAIEVVIDEHVVRELIPDLLELGAEGIIEYPLNKVIY